jgi:site-specific DNA-methyltransferase (adenine-specific)
VYGSGALNVDGTRIGRDIVGWSGNPHCGRIFKGKYADTKKEARPVTGRYPANLMLDDTVARVLGGQSRFFYCTKASTSERDAGLDKSNNTHPCVKPLNLCRYFATLILPSSSVEHRRLLVPFSGSGSEMIGALLAGWDDVTGVEMDANYCRIAHKRIEHALASKNAPVILPGLEELACL